MLQLSPRAYLRFTLSAETNRHHREHGRGSQRRPGRDLRALLGLGQPEGDPRTHHYQSQGNVDLQHEEALLPLELEGEGHGRDVSNRVLPHARELAVGPVDHVVLGEADVLHGQRVVLPFVEDVICLMAKAADLERAALLVEGEFVQVHLAARLYGQPLRVGDHPVGRNPDKPVRHGDLVQVRLLPVDDVGVGTPDLVQELPVHGKLVEVSVVVKEPGVAPILSENKTFGTYVRSKS